MSWSASTAPRTTLTAPSIASRRRYGHFPQRWRDAVRLGGRQASTHAPTVRTAGDTATPVGDPAAASLFLLSGLGNVVSTPLIIWHLAREGELPHDRASLLSPHPRLDLVAGVWLWQGRRRRATLGLATSPLLLALGLAFAVPFMPLTAPVRAAGVLVGRAACAERRRPVQRQPGPDNARRSAPSVVLTKASRSRLASSHELSLCLGCLRHRDRAQLLHPAEL